MQLFRKNNIIVNAVKHKGTIEEKHSHIETPRLVEDQSKTHHGENPFKFYFLLDCHWMIQQKRVQDPYLQNHNPIRQNSTKQNHEMNPTMLMIKTPIQTPIINYHCLWSTTKPYGQRANFAINWSNQTLGPNCRDNVMYVRMKGFSRTDESAYVCL